MTDPANVFKRLSSAEALRALYIDFEGGKDQLAILLGVLRRGGKGSTPFVHQDVVDKAFASLGLSAISLREAVEKAVLRAEHGDRRIVSWIRCPTTRLPARSGRPSASCVARWSRGSS